MIIGSLLGDGAMRCKRNALLEVNHCAAQRSYVDWKYQTLSNLVRTPPKLRGTNGKRIAYRFTTLSLPELTAYYRRFYPLGKKIVPNVTVTPLALAVWLMDDGHKSYNTIYLNTQQFSAESQRGLLSMLKHQWDISAALNIDKAYFRIRISVRSVQRLKSLVEPYLLPAFRYKIPE